MQILENYRFARIGFGTGHSIESSISQAVYDCPFLGKGVKVRKPICDINYFSFSSAFELV